MNSRTELRALLESEKKNRGRTPRATQILRLSVALALSVTAVASAQSYRVLKNFTGTDGASPLGSLVLAGDHLYGTTAAGGSAGFPRAYGVVFKLNTNGSDYAVLKVFTDSDGSQSNPYSGLAFSGGTLYGTTYMGGSSRDGMVYKLNTDGSGFAVVKNFTGSDGMNPWGGLVLSGSTLYGTTSGGGSYGNGTVFRVETDGTGFTNIYNFTSTPDPNFTNSDGALPCADLLLAGSTLYGTTFGGGTLNLGVVFKVNTDGSSFAVLKSFTGSDGANPFGGLALSGNTLYGTTEYGGSAYEGPFTGDGVAFKVNTDGSDFAVLKNFAGSDGINPQADLVLAGNTIYGTTYGGGSSYGPTNQGGYGEVFKMNTDGSGFAVLKSFTGSDGSGPQAGPVLVGNTIYGTTSSGGSSSGGVVFKLEFLSITTPPSTQTAETSTTVGFQVEAASPVRGLAYQWFFGGTNALGSATNSALYLTNIQPAQAGAYTVAVTNLMEGAVTSAPALLSVIPAVDRRIVPAVHLMGGAGSFLHLEYADSLAAPQWSSLSNLTMSGGPQLCFDLCQPLPAQRVYRAWQNNGPRASLDATMATEIPLTGAVGSSVRVDYINQFGPTDAWVTLDTVLLTNSPQFYYDLTAFRQPARLYRLVPLP